MAYLPNSRFSEDEQFAVALALRDWIHGQPWSECGVFADTCPDWPKAFEIRNIALKALEDAMPPVNIPVTDEQVHEWYAKDRPEWSGLPSERKRLHDDDRVRDMRHDRHASLPDHVGPGEDLT